MVKSYYKGNRNIFFLLFFSFILLPLHGFIWVSINVTVKTLYKKRNEPMIPCMTFRVSAQNNIFSMLCFRRVYPNRINLLWKQRKALAKKKKTFYIHSRRCSYLVNIAEEWLVIHKLCIDLSCTQHEYIYKVWVWEVCIHLRVYISAVNNDSCKIKAKCLHSFLLIL